MPCTRQQLNKWSDAGRVVQNNSRAKKKCVRVQRNAARGTVVAAKVADDAEVGDRFIGDGPADTILAEIRRLLRGGSRSSQWKRRRRTGRATE